ncbi:MAG: hypothetical protein U9R56_00265 [candidate division Zixibacteria bacterium]|nr:hypothetical protein [candidate division Zixibacteria bacterium]
MKRYVLNSESGFATLIALIMVGMLTLLGIAALSTSDDEVNIAGNGLQEMRAFYAAEAGLEVPAALLQTEYDSTGVPPTIMPSGTMTLNNCAVSYTTADDGPATQRVLSTGTLAGLHALVKSFSIVDTAVNLSDPAKVVMSQSFETALVPIFQFAIFYGNDLEIAPGPAMNLGGRVHTNGNLWLQSGSGLRMDSYVTSAGEILHGRKGAGGVSTGDVEIMDGTGTYVSMKEGAGWLDADDSHWYDSSVARWQGRVQDSEHGQGEMNVPLTASASGDPHKLIEPTTGNPDSYERKSSLKFIDRRAYRKADTLWVDVTDTMTALGIISFNDDQFTDQREGTTVDVMELDIEEMYDEGYDPPNGVIYYSDATSDFPAVRLREGEELEDPLTVASENPVYTLGDYNSDDKKPAAIMADAVTFLSSTWDDTKSNLNKSNRIAVNTTVNASYMTGNTETTDFNYNGGFENLPRFLEVWSGIDFDWSGSAVNLWNSVQANGDWSGSYYSPPNRNWIYDTDLDDPSKLPPESPVIRVFQRTGWKQEFVGY